MAAGNEAAADDDTIEASTNESLGKPFSKPFGKPLRAALVRSEQLDIDTPGSLTHTLCTLAILDQVKVTVGFTTSNERVQK